MTAALASVALEPGAFSSLGGGALSLGSLPQGAFSTFTPTPRGQRFQERRSSSSRALSLRDTDFGSVHHYYDIDRDNDIANMPESPSLRCLEGAGAAGVGTFICNTKTRSRISRNQERNAPKMPAEGQPATSTQKFHPLACSVVDKDAFNNDIMATAGFTATSADEVEQLVYLRDGSAGKANWAEQVQSGVKRLPAAVLGDVDKVVFHHALFEREENAAATYRGLAGKPMWEGTSGNLESTLELTRDGQHRSARRVKPPSQPAYSDVSWTNRLSRDSQRKDTVYAVSPTYSSCLGAVLFGSAPGDSTNICKRPEFRKQFKGAAGKTTHDLAKKTMRDEYPKPCLKSDAASTVSTAASSEVSLASSSSVSLASSRREKQQRMPSSKSGSSRSQATATPRRPRTAR